MAGFNEKGAQTSVWFVADSRTEVRTPAYETHPATIYANQHFTL
jgi:hypothetical protein